jgi:hypothetical protein
MQQPLHFRLTGHKPFVGSLPFIPHTIPHCDQESDFLARCVCLANGGAENPLYGLAQGHHWFVSSTLVYVPLQRLINAFEECATHLARSGIAIALDHHHTIVQNTRATCMLHGKQCLQRRLCTAAPMFQEQHSIIQTMSQPIFRAPLHSRA